MTWVRRAATSRFILLKMIMDAIMGSVPFDVRKAMEVQEDAAMDLSRPPRGEQSLGRVRKL